MRSQAVPAAMKSQALLAAMALFLLALTLTVVLTTVDLRSHSPFVFPTYLSTRTLAPPAPLRVYMYDLHPRFNVRMLGYAGDAAPPDTADFPSWPRRSGLKKQHSVEYWMMASLVEAGRGEEKDFVRVRDGDRADVFFVPFFSSLSFNTHGHNMRDPETEVDRQLQADLISILKGSKYWRRSGGHDHVIPLSHPNAFRFLRSEVNASIFVVVDFGRNPQNVSSLRKDIVAPYVHLVDSYLDDNLADPYESRKTLLFFRGRTVRKDEGRVRAKLAKILKGQDDVHFEDSPATAEAIKASTLGMRSSKYCLHPAGDTPSSCRLFDAIVSHCIPVIVSDRIELPFEDEIDYNEFSLFFSVEEALQPEYMVTKLRDIPQRRWIEMWTRLKNISYRYEFHYPSVEGDAVNMLWRQVRHKLPAVKLAIHRSRRLKIPDWWI